MPNRARGPGGRRPMGFVREWVTRFWGSLRRRRRDADLEQELRLHLELTAEDERRRAASGEAATRAALMRARPVAHGMDAVRDQRGLPWLDDLARDLRYAWRTLRRSPVFSAVTVL